MLNDVFAEFDTESCLHINLLSVSAFSVLIKNQIFKRRDYEQDL